MPASTYSGNAILNLFLRGVAVAPPTSCWVSLHTADPGNTGLNEVTAGEWPAYARQEPSQGAAIATGFTAAANKATENTNQVLYPAQNGPSDVTITHFGIWDDENGGNLLFYGPLTSPRQLFPTDEIVIHATELDVGVG